MTFKLMTSQVVQRARPLITHICVVGIQRVKRANDYSQCSYDQNHLGNDQEYVAYLEQLIKVKEWKKDLKSNYNSAINFLSSTELFFLVA